MAQQVIVIGAGGHGKVVADIVLRSGHTLLGFLDDSQAVSPVAGIPMLGTVDCYARYPQASFVLAIGSAAARQTLSRKLTGVNWLTAIHPSAVISPLNVTIGPGSVIGANAVVNPGASIGSHCIINTGAIVEHDNKIGDFCHISVGAKLGGGVCIGDSTWVGIGVTVSNHLCICGNCTIGAGAVVIRNIRESGTYVGIPARILP